jgi:hypothetical protein
MQEQFPTCNQLLNGTEQGFCSRSIIVMWTRPHTIIEHAFIKTEPSYITMVGTIMKRILYDLSE